MHRRLLALFVIGVCGIVIAACGSSKSSTSSSSATDAGASGTGSGTAASSTTTAATSTSGGPTMGFEAVPLEHGPLLGPAMGTQTATVDGIQCNAGEQLAYHIHAHLAVFDAGRLYALPAGVGIPGSQVVDDPQAGPEAGGNPACIYWLHTHTTDGIIHIESPTKRIYTLGDFFDVWRQPLTSSRIASLHGAVTAFVNGKPWKRSPRDIPLVAHADIQLDIGQPIPPLVTIDWSQTQL